MKLRLIFYKLNFILIYIKQIIKNRLRLEMWYNKYNLLIIKTIIYVSIFYQNKIIDVKIYVKKKIANNVQIFNQNNIL